MLERDSADNGCASCDYRVWHSIAVEVIASTCVERPHVGSVCGSVAVVVGVGVVAYSVTVGVDVLCRIQWECVGDVPCSIVVVISVEGQGACASLGHRVWLSVVVGVRVRALV